MINLIGIIFSKNRNIKNIVIGNKVRKTLLIELGAIQKLVEMMSREDSTIEFIIEAVVVLGSFARGLFTILLFLHPGDVVLGGVK